MGGKREKIKTCVSKVEERMRNVELWRKKNLRGGKEKDGNFRKKNQQNRSVG